MIESVHREGVKAGREETSRQAAASGRRRDVSVERGEPSLGVEMSRVDAKGALVGRSVESSISVEEKLERVNRAMAVHGYDACARKDCYLLRVEKGKAKETGKIDALTEADLQEIERGNFVFRSRYSCEKVRKRVREVGGMLVGTTDRTIMEAAIGDKKVRQLLFNK